MKLELEQWEVTLILKALAKLPYEESVALIRKIVHQQAEQESK